MDNNLMDNNLMDMDNIYKIVDKLIDDLPDELKNTSNPIEIDLVLDGGVFNGSYLTGALFFIKEMEKRNYIKIKRISGCSIGALVGFLYFIDGLDLVTKFYDIIIKHFKKTCNFEIYKDLKKHLNGRIPLDVCKKVNKKLFITYNNIQTGLKKVKSVYKTEDEIIDTIIRSSFFPYLIDGNIANKDKYIDGFNPYIFKPRNKRRILFMDLSGLDKFTNILNIKNEKTNFYRILSGILDIHIFLTKQTETFMCSYVDEWNYSNKIRLYIRLIIEQIICYMSYLVILFKKYMTTNYNDNYNIISKLLYDILFLLIHKYCL